MGDQTPRSSTATPRSGEGPTPSSERRTFPSGSSSRRGRGGGWPPIGCSPARARAPPPSPAGMRARPREAT